MPETGATATFRVVGEGEFTGGGFRCWECHRPVDVGQPYGSAYDGMTVDVEPMVALLCAYCAVKP